MQGLVQIDNLYVIVIYRFISDDEIRCVDLNGNEFCVNCKQLIKWKII